MLGQGCRAPPRSPPPACRARGQLGFRSPFCRQGWYVHHKLWTAWLPLTVNVSELFWAGRSQSRRQQTGRVLLAPPPAAGVSCFQRALGFPSTDPPRARPRHQHDAAVPGFPHLPGLPQCLGEGRSTCHPPPSFASRCARKLARKDTGAHSDASTVPQTAAQPPSCCCFLPSLPSGHQFQQRDRGIFLLSWDSVKPFYLWWPADEPEAFSLGLKWDLWGEDACSSPLHGWVTSSIGKRQDLA